MSEEGYRSTPRRLLGHKKRRKVRHARGMFIGRSEYSETRKIASADRTGVVIGVFESSASVETVSLDHVQYVTFSVKIAICRAWK